MRLLAIAPQYIRWHYSQALITIIAITKNIVWFFWHFFSIQVLFATLFSPWQKLHEERPKGSDLGPILSTLVINSLMRMAGGLIRLFIIVIGLATMAGTIIAALAFLAFWLALPLCALFVFVLGFVFLIKLS